MKYCPLSVKSSFMPAVCSTAARALLPLALAVAAGATRPSFAAKPYDAVVEYLEAPNSATTAGSENPYITTSLMPADDLGARFRFMSLVNGDFPLFGQQTSAGKNWYFGGSSRGYYFSWVSTISDFRPPVTNSTLDVYFNHLNSRVMRLAGVDGSTVTLGGQTQSEVSRSINTAWSSTGTLYPIWIFNFNQKGSPYGNGGHYRVFSAQFTKGSEVVMDLIPVRKDGVGYLYDKVSGELLGNSNATATVSFTYGDDIDDDPYIEGSVTLDADADWTSRGILHLDSSAVIDLNGHTLRIVGAFGDGTITDNSAGDPGLLRVTAESSVATPVTVATSGNMTVLRSAKPYDAELEYLEAPIESNNAPYIDTGLYPGDDMGALIRFTPLRTADSTLCGVQTTSNNKWYFGGSSKFYLSWMTTPASGDRPDVSVGSTYDVYFNHLNDRKRRLVGVGNDRNHTNNIVTAWSQGSGELQTIYLYHFNDQGHRPVNKSGVLNYLGNYRVYSAQFTQGDEVVMDLIPVRKDGVGYMYDRVSERLLGTADDTPDFTYVSDAAGEAYVEGNVTLDADADWTSRGILRFDDLATIDLNGHSLTIAGVKGYGTLTLGAGTITNSSETVGELHFVVPEGSAQTCSLAILGNIKVFKEGDGALSFNHAGQTFTGGVMVEGGTAKAAASCPENGCYWGAEGGTITVNDGATFDVNGVSYFHCKDFILNGGTLRNATSGMDSAHGIGNVTLAADSAMEIGSYLYTYFASPNPATFDLGGHTLTVNATAGGQFNIAFPIVNGTLEYETGGYLSVPESASSGSATLDLKMLGAAFFGDGALSVSNYLASYTKQWNHGSYQLKVYGTFTPAGVDEDGYEYFHGCEMQDGSTIDLSAKTAAWDTTATGWSGTGDSDGSRTVAFATNATVTLDLHGRTLAKGEKVVNWVEAPANLATLTFALDAATAESGESLVVTESGIYYGADESTVAHAWWTGLIDNDLSKPGNWACTNFMGGAVADGLPGASATVHVSGDVGFQIPTSQPLTYDSIVFSGVTLTNDCDWTGIAEWAAATDMGDLVDLGSVDLNGRSLTLATATTSDSGFIYDFVSFSVTDTSAGTPGELHIVVPGETTYLVCSGFALSGNLKLVKEGSGWLAMTKADQTFTGGVLVAEGTAYSPLNSYPETGNYWGPSNGTITVAADATFDIRANTRFWRKNFVLNGGTLANTANMGTSKDSNNIGIGSVTLAANSHFVVTNAAHTYFSLSGATPAEKIDLGGHTLTVSTVSGNYVHVPLNIENGTLDFVRITDGSDGGYLYTFAGTTAGSPTVNIDMETTALYLDGALSVSNYVAGYTGYYNHGGAAIKVYGTFTPAAVRTGGDAFHGCEMQDGSYIDLSAKTAGWSNVALGWTGTGNADGNRTVTFADGATVGILLGPRNVKSQEKLIDWSSAAPTNDMTTLTFFGQFADGSTITLKAKDDGLYAPRKGFIIIVR